MTSAKRPSASRRPIDEAIRLERRVRRRLRYATVRLVRFLLPFAEKTSFSFIPLARLREVALHQPALDIRRPVIRPEAGKRRILLVSHDLSLSGAPNLLLAIARILVDADWDVTLLSLAPGDLCAGFLAIGVPVIVGNFSFREFRDYLLAIGSCADIMICNTVDTQSVVETLADRLPTLWYIHEISLLKDRLPAQKGLPEALAKPQAIWAGSELAAGLLRDRRPDVMVVPYGLHAISRPVHAEPAASWPLHLAVLGSYESRKGQDLLVDAFTLLTAEQRASLRIDFYGRTLDEDYFSRLRQAARPFDEIRIHGEIDPASYRKAVIAAHAVVVPSRDDTLPLVSLDTLGARRVLMCTATTGTAAYIVNGISGFIACEPSATALATMLAEAIDQRDRFPEIAEAGEKVFQASFSVKVFGHRLLGICEQMSLNPVDSR